MDDFEADIFNKLGERLSVIRENIGFSKTSLAEVLRVDRRVIGNAEKGVMGSHLIVKLVRVYGISLTALLDYNQPMPDYKKISKSVADYIMENFPDDVNGIKVNIHITTLIKALLDDPNFFATEKATSEVNSAIQNSGEKLINDTSLISQILLNFAKDKVLAVRKVGGKNYYKKR